MNIIGYIKKYGNLSFQEKPLNNVDALILTTLTYLHFELMIDENGSMVVSNVPDDFIPLLCEGEFTTRSNEKMFRLLKTVKRYRNIEVRYVYSVHDKLNTIQFFGMTLIIPGYHPFVCYRGTDLTLVGWKENLMLATNKVVPSQVEVYNYTNYVSKKINGPFSIGGHSKGGNLALFTAIYSKPDIQERFDKVYVFDGPGFNDNKIFSSDKYLRVKDKIIQFVPKDDVVGCLLYTPKDKLIIKAKSVHFLQHNPYLWIINRKGDFKYSKKGTRFARVRRRTMMLWINQLTPEDCELMIDKIVDSLGGIDSTLSYRLRLIALKFKTFISSYFGYSKDVRKRIRKLMLLYFKIWRESRIYYLKHPKED
ncbi:MAG: DUF2974 domain-containing protein [Bacilli bacterium]|nr:DUF2974 domain-containing protein [Bacilli bacterium]